MSSRAWQLRVQDILDAITSIEQRTAEMTFEKFAANKFAITFNFNDQLTEYN